MCGLRIGHEVSQHIHQTPSIYSRMGFTATYIPRKPLKKQLLVECLLKLFNKISKLVYQQYAPN